MSCLSRLEAGAEGRCGEGDARSEGQGREGDGLESAGREFPRSGERGAGFRGRRGDGRRNFNRRPTKASGKNFEKIPTYHLLAEATINLGLRHREILVPRFPLWQEKRGSRTLSKNANAVIRRGFQREKLI